MIGERDVTVRLKPHESIVIVSDEHAHQYRVWSEPVQFMVEPSGANHDVLDLTFRRYECPERHC